MSFETVFEKWLLQKQGVEEGDNEGTGQQPVNVACDHVDQDDSVEEEMPVIQREAWREEDMEGMPVLQKMVDLPSIEEGRKLRSPPPPPLQITLSLTESHRKERHSKSSKNKFLVRDKAKRLNKLNSNEKDYEKRRSFQDASPFIQKTKISRVQAGGEQNCCIHKVSYHHDPKDSDLKEKAVHQCHAKSALTELTQLSHSTSPMVARGSEVDSVRSPECDLPMEPDSTSEFLVGSGRWLRTRKGCETSRGEVSPWREVSPRSTGCIGLRTPNSSSSEILRRVESSPAECDSTSMFMNSPSAISPASQGEIEERVCPVLADHEDSASPSHCVCRCRSLPPPSDLMGRDHTPVAITTSQLTVKIPKTISYQTESKSWTALVSRTHSVDDDPAPDLEKVAPSLDLMGPPDVLQSDHDSPPVLTLPEQEARVKQFSVDHCQTKDVAAEANQQEAPPLIRYEPEPPQVNSGDTSVCSKYSDSPPVLSSSDFDCQVNCNESPPVLSLHGQETSVRPGKAKRQTQTDVCDFTSNIDWKTAVVETVENPPHLTKYDGENKPGIIIKIRTKGKTATSCVQLVSGPKPLPKAVPIKRKRHTVDNSEIMSRLRKRHKSEVDKSATSMSAKEEPETLSVGSKAMDMQQKAVGGNPCSHASHTRPKDKKPRRNTVQLGDLKVSTQDLSLEHSMFAQSLVQLCRLQTLTHELVCILFPRLQPHLNHITPMSRGFTRIIANIILSLERSTSEEIMLDCEDLNEMFTQLSLTQTESVPVFSPQVVLCRSPEHIVEDFRAKVCSLFQLLLPDLTVSLTHTLAHSSEKLELFLKKVIVANKAKVAKKSQF